METKSLVGLFWEEMGLLIVLIVPILMAVVAPIGHRIAGLFDGMMPHRPS